MTFKPDTIDTVLTDSYTTIIEQLSPPEILEPYTEEPERAARLWGTRAVEFGLVATILGEFQSCRLKYEMALEYTLTRFSIDISEDEREIMLEAWEHRQPFDDVKRGLTQITDAGYEVFILSDGDRDMLENILETPGIGEHISGMVSASDIGFYKPDPQLYRHAATRVQTPVTRIAYVSASWYDVLGAMACGMQGIWINRTDDVWMNFLGTPDAEITTLPELADLLPA